MTTKNAPGLCLESGEFIPASELTGAGCFTSDTSEAAEVRAACSEIVKTLVEIVTVTQTDAEFDADVLPRDPIVMRVQRIKAYVDSIYRALQIPVPTIAPGQTEALLAMKKGGTNE